MASKDEPQPHPGFTSAATGERKRRTSSDPRFIARTSEPPPTPEPSQKKPKDVDSI
jgi:hypothetical protein